MNHNQLFLRPHCIVSVVIVKYRSAVKALPVALFFFMVVTGEVVLVSFHPERVLFSPGGVNLRLCLCGVPTYASAQTLDFPCQKKKSPLSESETSSFSSGVSGWKLVRKLMSVVGLELSRSLS
jgi:hypothetical protein